MRIGLIDRAMYAVMASACIKELRKEHADWDGSAIRRNARRRFGRMMKETPSIGACLHRDKTLATGDSCCDYLYTRPGSEAEKRWLAEHPEGSFISK